MQIIFSTQSYQYLSENVIQNGNVEKGEIEIKQFPDGERYLRIISSVKNRDVVLIGGTISDADTLELYDLACALVKYGAISLTLVIPYFGFSTMERAVQYGEVVTAKTRSILISSIPKAPMGNRVLLFDLHSEGLPHYFEGSIQAFHIYCKDLIKEAAQSIGGTDFVLASTDAGRAKWVESLANDMHVQAAFVFKRRISGNETKITSISADVKNKNVIIYDDMIRTGGSLIDAAMAYKNAGANQISVICTHGLFVGDSFQKLLVSGLFENIYSTDTHPNVLKIKDAKFKYKSINQLILNNL